LDEIEGNNRSLNFVLKSQREREKKFSISLK